ncbi:hypothetical protein EN792_038910 [Mesorhizobium sp. M00.F.Ca.ET.149.01.1.1]|nr:hypothetical protein EN792_038910 [Mesorhizobium sp. M00.F.Ca.ET.149.01.1.1]
MATTTVPQNILTKYAVVRAPKTMSPQARQWNLVTRPNEATALWSELSSLASKNAPSSSFEAECTNYLKANPIVSAEGEFPSAFSNVRSASIGLPASDNVSNCISRLQADPNPFDDEAKSKEFILWLWDQLSARIILSNSGDELAPEIVRAIAYLHAKTYAASVTKDDAASSLAIRPEVVMPRELTEFIRAARNDLRQKQKADAKKEADLAASAARSKTAKVLNTAALGAYIRDAFDSFDFEYTPLSVQQSEMEVMAAGDEELAGTTNRQVLKLSADRLKRIPPALTDFANAELGLANIADVDPIYLLNLLTSHRSRLEADLLHGLSPSIVWRTSEIISAAAVDLAFSLADIISVIEKIIATIGINKTYTLPDFKNPNQVSVAGLCDLKVVRQQLQKYVLGEVAYIENVLKGEERSRTHHTLDRTEQQLLIEVDESSSTERDLQTRDRFELNQELDNVQKENRTSDMGVNVTASYGAITVAAHANATSNSSAENAEKVARSSVKENISRAVEKVQRSTRRQQTITVTTEVTEDNVHKFIATTQSTVGVYRYVEKRYWNQVFNYGARLMIEFLIPEPAVGYLYYQSKSPRSDDSHLIAPEQPNFTAAQITEYTYQTIAARYNAQVAAPPPAMAIGSAMIDSSAKEGKQDPSVALDTDYEAIYIWPAMSFIWSDARAKLSVILGGNYWYLGTAKNDYIHGSPYLVNALRGTVGFHVHPFLTNDWTVGLTLVLHRTSEAYGKWQLATYHAIIDAYNLAKDDYDKKIAAARSKSREVVMRSDVEYRNTEQHELKRGALELLTNQHFGSMGAISLSGSGEPTLDAAKAIAEGPTVKFFEQAFEWQNMVYTFYPYFWGRHDTWEDRLSVADADPVFSRFLSAGYARVVIPVRRYFENNIKYYLEHGEIWEGEDCPVPGDPDYIAIVDEIKDIEAAGSPDLQDGIPDGDPWQLSLPTPLVCLDDPSVQLPSWEITIPATTPYIPSAEVCNGVPYNFAQWPDDASLMAEMTALGYGIPAKADPKTYLHSAEGMRVVKAFQRRMNQLGVADALGAPLKIDGVAGPCTRRAFTLAAEWRRLKQWPGPV